MILSHKWRFVFIKGRKVGGTSVEIALSTVCGPGDIITPIEPVDEFRRLRLGAHCQNYSRFRLCESIYLRRLRMGLARKPAGGRFWNHMALTEVLARTGGGLAGYAVIAAERCPYRKVMSFANMQLSVKQYRKGGRMLADIGEVRAIIDRLIADGRAASVRNIDLYRDGQGAMAARILRNERLDEDFAAFCREVGLPHVPALPRAKEGLNANAIEPADFFTRPQINAINRIFADEFEAFGYRTV